MIEQGDKTRRDESTGQLNEMQREMDASRNATKNSGS